MTNETPKLHYKDIPKLRRAHYGVDVDLDFLEQHVQRYIDDYSLDLNPDFQRGHVWTQVQRERYMEWLLRGGETGRDIYFNCPGWQGAYDGTMVIVDGLQRLTTCRMFVANEVQAFGRYMRDFAGRPGLIGLRFHVANYKSRADVLQWYLDINSGGTIHSADELARVQALLNAEKGGK